MTTQTKPRFKAEKFAVDLFHYRSENKLSREKFASEIPGLTASIVRHYENQITQPPIENVVAICSVLGTTAAEYVK